MTFHRDLYQASFYLNVQLSINYATSSTGQCKRCVADNNTPKTKRYADRRDSKLRIRMKRNASELVGEYAMLKGEARKLLRVKKINFRQEFKSL